MLSKTLVSLTVQDRGSLSVSLPLASLFVHSSLQTQPCTHHSISWNYFLPSAACDILLHAGSTFFPLTQTRTFESSRQRLINIWEYVYCKGKQTNSD